MLHLAWRTLPQTECRSYVYCTHGDMDIMWLVCCRGRNSGHLSCDTPYWLMTSSGPHERQAEGAYVPVHVFQGSGGLRAAPSNTLSREHDIMSKESSVTGLLKTCTVRLSKVMVLTVSREPVRPTWEDNIVYKDPGDRDVDRNATQPHISFPRSQ